MESFIILTTPPKLPVGNGPGVGRFLLTMAIVNSIYTFFFFAIVAAAPAPALGGYQTGLPPTPTNSRPPSQSALGAYGAPAPMGGYPPQLGGSQINYGAPAPALAPAPVPVQVVSTPSLQKGVSHDALGHNGRPVTISEIKHNAVSEDNPSDPDFVCPASAPRVLKIRVKERVFVKIGSMIAYKGHLKFEKGSGGGLSKKLMKSITGEGVSFMKADGHGILYVSDQNKEIHLLKLSGGHEGISVNGNDVLAMESSLSWDIKMIKGSGGHMAGGMFNVVITGTGVVAISTHGTPLVMGVNNSGPLITDPNATVAWSSNLAPRIKTDLKLKSFLGQSSGEEFQMEFQGEGFVLVQPFEEFVPM